ncbi:unnamed protein product [Bursaphelenchus okinawaensis]|uniref:Uncharacterized protein n=1 Tax=Bursaphelenchus okinawaensis TaxID=465554 RepID=A0A811LI21_9BILA|nr:unnamed protein product [Bursaphelenchus okinawaensis]CAG9126059.1 unnamed protein product [Bursaphelenchus okinawaensis]
MSTENLSCSVENWKRLKQLVDACNNSKRRCEDVKELIQELMKELPSTSDLVSQVKNKEVLLEIRKKELEDIRKYRRTILLLHTRSENKDEEIRNKFDVLSKDLDETGFDIVRNKEEIDIATGTLTKLKNELLYRRRFMLEDLYLIYFVDDCYMRYFKKRCHCIKYDLIYGLHLPSAPDKHEHSDNEICAAVSHLVNLLICLSKICDYSFKYPIVFKGSNSMIVKRSNGEYFDFHFLIVKNRTKLVEALRFLSENVVQFRADCGLRTTESERIIPNLRELLLSCIGRYCASFDYIRPSQDFRSVAALIPVNPNLSMVKIVKTPPSQHRTATSILDVVTASPSTFIATKAK